MKWTVKVRKKVNRLFVLWSARSVLTLAKMMPYRLGIFAGACLGFVGFYILRRERNRAEANLAIVFKDKSETWIRSTARKCFVHLGKSFLEMVLITPVRLSEVARIEGIENLNQAMDQGKGVIYFTGHVGNWELSGGVIGSKFPLSVVAAPLEPEALNSLI